LYFAQSSRQYATLESGKYFLKICSSANPTGPNYQHYFFLCNPIPKII